MLHDAANLRRVAAAHSIDFLDQTLGQHARQARRDALVQRRTLGRRECELEPAAGLQRFSATIEAVVTPDIDTALDEAPAKTAFWNAFKAVGSWYAELPPY